MKILGLDVGEKRIGIAISDAMGVIALGVETFYREEENGIIEKLRSIIKTESVTAIVVGLPLNMNGTEGPKAKEAKDFAEKLKKEIGLPVTLWDERLSTAEVERLMISAGASRAKRKKKIDKLAAQVILQGYLDSRKHE